ncbi:MAG: hypothetical protein EOQ56_28065 [Mesorhizobium sp.]|nr:MAG: hypothetical protein EOQ56_28065 [Mesorhizobium sp.]
MTDMNDKAPVGTRLFFVPIRFWEDYPIETGYVAEHTTFEGEVVPSWSQDHVYAFHDGYGHNVYMQAPRSFLTEAEALAEKERLATEKKVKDDEEFEVVWQRIKEKMGWR